MKKRRIIGSLIFALSLLVLTHCKEDDPQTETERISSLLQDNTWLIQSVTIDENEETELFTDLTLSFTNTSYTTTNGGVVWPASGTWQFADETGKIITRDDGLQIMIDEITKSTLTLSLSWSTTTLGSGRVASLAGEHQFTFIAD